MILNPNPEILYPNSSNPKPKPYRGSSLTRNTPSLGTYSRTKPRALWWAQGERLFLMSEVFLSTLNPKP